MNSEDFFNSKDFFVIESGVFKDADEAFELAVKKNVTGNNAIIEGKNNCVVIEVPKGKDPLAVAKERADQHGNDFWNFVDGPAACVEIKGKWLRAKQPDNVKETRGFKMFVFFGRAFSRPE